MMAKRNIKWLPVKRSPVDFYSLFVVTNEGFFWHPIKTIYEDNELFRDDLAIKKLKKIAEEYKREHNYFVIAKMVVGRGSTIIFKGRVV